MPAKPKSKSPFPQPAAVLPGEADILANVIANLADHDAKLVYADWLEERDDPRGPLLREFVTAYRAGTKLPKVKSAPKPWRDLVAITLMGELRGSPLFAKGDRLLALARPAIVHDPTNAPEASLPVGTSKFGGRPDLPVGVEWPEYEGVALTFLGQYNLADLQVSPVARELPASGVLSLFCLRDEERDPGDFTKGTWRVFHFREAAELARRDFPDLPEYARPSHLPPSRLTFTEAQSLPNLYSPWKKELLRLVPANEDAETTLVNFVDPFQTDGLLGYPPTLGLNALGKKPVRQLVTIGDYAELDWIDGDVMYFVIAGDDLKRGLLDRARMNLETY
jgi:uncharacterized protein (TIGR02996 family)